ncbi:hypothetical protein [Candidatus Stoquefichus sp. SB1]|jgi:hypothetical protein|uniref:hypothetical protein n=1 Tax=Candidatus Stoquefichus sp. SB1 TaxID=1658109 RepID=UPI00067EE7D2|nr:hypothetical protein [Candidatus Stoquefichus sp. SB1]
MAKILLVSSGLKHAQEFVEPFLKRLEVYLSGHDDCVIDVRNAANFDERVFFEYDQVVFLLTIALDSIPSSTLEIFEKLENQLKNNTEVYALIACDEYEPEKCNLSEKIIKKWCEKENLQFKGSLKIGSVLFIMKSASKFVVSNYIKSFASAILKHEETHSKVTMLTDKIFMKTANKYWNKEIRKKHKEKAKNAS